MTIINNGIYAITDCINLDEQTLLERSELILRHGISLFQYRNKNQTSNLNLAKSLQTLCKEFNTPFIINDDVDLAYRIKADGIHLGKNDCTIEQARERLGAIIIGKSCYNDLDNALSNEQIDYAAFGAFYPSKSKPDAIQADFALLERATETLTIPIVAIGGITPNNAKPLLNAGANMLAVISALFHSEHIQTTMAQFTESFTN